MLRLARTFRALRWLVLPLAVGVAQGAFEPSAHGAPAAKRVKKKKKKSGPSMDDNAGRDVDEGGTAPGTTDSKASEIEIVDQTPKKPKPGEAPPEEVTLEEEDAPPDTAPVGPPPAYSLNWISLNIQQELLVYGDTKGVCPSANDAGKEFLGAAGYSCRDSEGVHKGDVYAGAGNEVHAGVGLATLRFTLGYDRIFIDRLALGARFGVAILQAPSVTGSKAAVPFHGEVRAAYYFGDSPFERHGLRPYVSLAAGFAEVDGKVSVEYYKDHIGYETHRQGRLDVWRQAGKIFVAPGIGASLPLGDFALNAEFRLLGLFPDTAFAPALTVGLAYGF
jgi:hypothetical protein